ncbi:MAG: ribonuclease R [Deltaproteobacteria bacterium]|nr:ribonuclease R [Deltaproteobacteria bacterium]
MTTTDRAKARTTPHDSEGHISREAILECLSRLVTPGIKLTALADELGARKHQYAQLREVLLDLVEEGAVTVLAGGAFALPPSGRASDPQGKPAPMPPEPVKAAGPPPPKKDKKDKKDRKDPRDKQRQQGALPWTGSRPAPRAVKAPSGPRQEYDPETGDMKTVPGSMPGIKVPPAPVAGVRPAPPPPAPVEGRIVGRITVHPAGYGFVEIEGGQTVFVPAKYRSNSLDGDRVAVDTWPGVRGTEGRVAEVLARGRARLTGILRRVARAVYLEPDDPRIASDYGRVAIDDAPSGAMGKDGDAVVIEITRYPDAARKELAGVLQKVLGDPDDPRTEIEKILACAVIPIEFPDEAGQQARATPQELQPADLADRIDLRDRRFCTIDPETARDFDDALCIEDGPHGGPRVWVAVADVSHYVRWGDALDKEATIRGVSVYLPDRVIPMLPIQLSANICSLNPLVDRCAMVVRLDYGEDAEVVDIGYAAAVIRSKARLDYPGVAAALGGDFRGRREEYRAWAGELERLNALARKLRARRQARGALELELSEPKVVLDADDPRLVRDVVKAKGDPAVKQAYQLVEEFMIAANEAVGNFFRRRNAPTVWRIHAPPAADRVAKLAELLGAYGIAVDVEAAVTPLGMKAVLDQIAEKPGAQGLSFLVLRTLTQAVWDTVPVGHFGLASGDYLHFTSPIRRYPDLLVHRLLKYHLHRDGHPSGGGYAKTPPTVDVLSGLARDSSAHERRAMEAEREAVAMYRAYLMRDQVGARFEGVISAVTSFGAFVEIESPYVEGLIKLDSLGDEPWDFDDVHMRLTGRKTRRMLELGDKVLVEINNVSVVRRRIDFTLVATAKTHVDGEKRSVKKSRRAGAAPEPTARAPIPQRKKAAREVERATRPHVERGASPRREGPGGKLRLGVSHRGGKKKR